MGAFSGSPPPGRDQASPARPDPVLASFVADFVPSSPTPFLVVELIRFRGLQHELVCRGMARCAEGFAPALPWPAFRRDDQTIAHDPHFDGLTEPALFNKWLRYANATGIADPNQICSHIQNHLCNYIVSTAGRFGKSPTTRDYRCASGTRTRIASSTRTISLENFSFPTFCIPS